MKSLWCVLVGNFCFALLIRLVFLAENIGVPFYNYRGIDSQQYHTMAVGFVDGTWPDGQVFRWPALSDTCRVASVWYGQQRDGTHFDHDSMLNFVDFAMFDGCCIEAVKD